MTKFWEFNSVNSRNTLFNCQPLLLHDPLSGDEYKSRIEQLQNELESLKSGAFATYVYDHCGSPDLVRTGRRKDPTFGVPGIKQKVSKCNNMWHRECFYSRRHITIAYTRKKQMTDFNLVLDRSGTPAEKWNKPALLKHFGRDDLLPFWVADMEFKAPPTVCNSLIERAENGIFGYEYKQGSLYNAIIQWYSTRHHWKIDKSDLRFSRGILNAISVLINLHTEEGDGIIIQPPVFFEFRLAIRDNKRNVIRNPLKRIDGRYQMDFEDLEEKAADPRTKMLILCNPHNPVGRVWGRDELQHVGEICKKHHVLVVSDEIHGDFVFKGHKYIPFASISAEIAQNSFTCLSPAKTFNIAAVTDGIVIIRNEGFRKQYDQFSKQLLINKTNAFSVVAMETAYQTGGGWLDQVLDYLQGNLSYLNDYLINRIPKVRLVELEGTFLAWLDFRELGMEAKELEVFLAEKARLALNSGYWFGRQGAGYARMTIACPQSILKEALARLEHATRILT